MILIDSRMGTPSFSLVLTVKKEKVKHRHFNLLSRPVKQTNLANANND